MIIKTRLKLVHKHKIDLTYINIFTAISSAPYCQQIASVHVACTYSLYCVIPPLYPLTAMTKAAGISTLHT